MESNKAYLIEGQILFQINKLRRRLLELKRMRDAEEPEITQADYRNAFYSCSGAIDQLMICLTSYDNPLSNFIAQEKKIKK